MTKAQYLEKYKKENAIGEVQLCDRHILMVNRKLKDKDGDPVYKPFKNSKSVIDTAQQFGWQRTGEAPEPAEAKKPESISQADYDKLKRELEELKAAQKKAKKEATDKAQKETEVEEVPAVAKAVSVKPTNKKTTKTVQKPATKTSSKAK